MASEDQVPPVTALPVDDTPPLPSIPAPRATPATNAFIAAASPSAPPADEQLAPGVQRAQMSPDAVSEPRSVETRATVHDAAVHGSRIARAIEAAQRGEDGHVINQQLAGAAASAASGQATPVDRTDMSPEAERQIAVDPLAATARIGDDDERHHRQQHEAELSAVDPEGSVEESIQDDR